MAHMCCRGLWVKHVAKCLSVPLGRTVQILPHGLLVAVGHRAPTMSLEPTS